MNIEVRYYSKSGNTKKIANAIAKQVGISAKSIHEPIQGEVDVGKGIAGVRPFPSDRNPPQVAFPLGEPTGNFAAKRKVSVRSYTSKKYMIAVPYVWQTH